MHCGLRDLDAVKKIICFDYAIQHYIFESPILQKTAQILVAFVGTENRPFKGRDLPVHLEAGVKATREILKK
jgi:hypothetical protein